MVVPWSDLEVPDTDFDVAALHAAIEERRTARSMTWTAVAREVNRSDERYDVRPISPSTISGLKNKRWGVEGDGVLPDARGVEGQSIEALQGRHQAVHRLRVEEHAGLTVHDGLERAAGREGHDRPAARLRLDRRDPEILFAGED